MPEPPSDALGRPTFDAAPMPFEVRSKLQRQQDGMAQRGQVLVAQKLSWLSYKMSTLCRLAYP